jgi:hypothetical protein
MGTWNIRFMARTNDAMRLEFALVCDIFLLLDGAWFSSAIFDFDRVSTEAFVGYNRLQQ